MYGADPSGAGFRLIKNSHRYWLADPFLFKYNSVDYLFVEMYDKRRSKGVLGYAVIKNGRCGRFRVCLELSHHLSYPCVFSRGTDVYMIPEAKESGEVTLYKATDFPRRWGAYKTLYKGPCVDTTPFLYNGKKYCFTTIANEKSTDDNLYLIDVEAGKAVELLACDLHLRSAGNVITDNGKMIRPSQDDTVYGDAVIFNIIEGPVAPGYKESSFRRLLPPGKAREPHEISVNLTNNKKGIVFDGLHTYNANANYEVVDLRYPRLKKHN